MRVLSIDYDYFVKVSETYRASFFPDGGTEAFQGLDGFVWGSYYATAQARNMPMQENVNADIPALEACSQFLLSLSDGTDFMIADSHRHAYSFIRDEACYDDVEVVNIDFHHDTFPTGEDVHCGNWLRILLEEQWVYRASWCPRPDSLRKNGIPELQEIPFEEALQGHFDLVFICRSGWWVPPHLDKYFIQHFIRPLVSANRCILLQHGLDKPRYTKDFIRYVSSIRKMIPDAMIGSHV